MDGDIERRGRPSQREHARSESRSVDRRQDASTGPRASRRALEYRAPSTDRNPRLDRQVATSKASRTPQGALDYRAASTDSNTRRDLVLSRKPAINGHETRPEQAESGVAPPLPPAVRSAFDDDDEYDAEKGERRNSRSSTSSKHSCCGGTRVRCASSYRKSRWCACCRWCARPHVKYTLQIMAACSLMALSIFFSSAFELTDDSWSWKTQFTITVPESQVKYVVQRFSYCTVPISAGLASSSGSDTSNLQTSAATKKKRQSSGSTTLLDKLKPSDGDVQANCVSAKSLNTDGRAGSTSSSDSDKIVQAIEKAIAREWSRTLAGPSWPALVKWVAPVLIMIAALVASCFVIWDKCWGQGHQRSCTRESGRRCPHIVKSKEMRKDVRKEWVPIRLERRLVQDRRGQWVESDYVHTNKPKRAVLACFSWHQNLKNTLRLALLLTVVIWVDMIFCFCGDLWLDTKQISTGIKLRASLSFWAYGLVPGGWFIVQCVASIWGCTYWLCCVVCVTPEDRHFEDDVRSGRRAWNTGIQSTIQSHKVAPNLVATLGKKMARGGDKPVEVIITDVKLTSDGYLYEEKPCDEAQVALLSDTGHHRNAMPGGAYAPQETALPSHGTLVVRDRPPRPPTSRKLLGPGTATQPRMEGHATESNHGALVKAGSALVPARKAGTPAPGRGREKSPGRRRIEEAPGQPQIEGPRGQRLIEATRGSPRVDRTPGSRLIEGTQDPRLIEEPPRQGRIDAPPVRQLLEAPEVQQLMKAPQGSRGGQTWNTAKAMLRGNRGTDPSKVLVRMEKSTTRRAKND